MTASQRCAWRGVSPSGVSLVSISASPGVERAVARDTVITDDFAQNQIYCAIVALSCELTT